MNGAGESTKRTTLWCAAVGKGSHKMCRKQLGFLATRTHECHHNCHATPTLHTPTRQATQCATLSASLESESKDPDPRDSEDVARPQWQLSIHHNRAHACRHAPLPAAPPQLQQQWPQPTTAPTPAEATVATVVPTAGTHFASEISIHTVSIQYPYSIHTVSIQQSEQILSCTQHPLCL